MTEEAKCKEWIKLTLQQYVEGFVQHDQKYSWCQTLPQKVDQQLSWEALKHSHEYCIWLPRANFFQQLFKHNSRHKYVEYFSFASPLSVLLYMVPSLFYTKSVDFTSQLSFLHLETVLRWSLI